MGYTDCKRYRFDHPRDWLRPDVAFMDAYSGISKFSGGFTTFSAFSLEAAVFFERKRFDMAFLYIGGTVLLPMGMVYAGLRATRTFLT